MEPNSSDEQPSTDSASILDSTLESTSATSSTWQQLNTVTTFSKYVALALFIVLPFLGAYVGYVYAPTKVVEVEQETSENESELRGEDWALPESAIVSSDCTVPNHTYPKLYDSDRYWGNDRETRFYSQNCVVYLNDFNNVSLRNLPFYKADPATFKHIDKFVGVDNTALHYADYLGGYVVFSITLADWEQQLFDAADYGKNISITWSEEVPDDSGLLTFKESSTSIAKHTNFEPVQLLLDDKPLADVLLYNRISSYSLKTSTFWVDGRLVMFKNEGVYVADFGEQPKQVLPVEPYRISYNPGSERLFYTETFNGLKVYEYNIVSGKSRVVFVAEDESITGSNRIFVNYDNTKLVTKVFSETDDYVGKQKEGQIIILGTEEGAIEAVAKSPLLPFMLSPDSTKIYAMTVPYEGYLFDTLKYYEKKNGVWSTEPAEVPDVHIEVGGGWNIDTHQWMISPNGRYLAYADSSEDALERCGGMGMTPTAHNQVKLYDLATGQIQVLVDGGVNQSHVIEYWEADGSGLHFVTYDLEVENDASACDIKTSTVSHDYVTTDFLK